MNAVECLLKSENCSVAARLDPFSPDAPILLELAAAWRMRAIEESHGSAALNHGMLEREGDIELWNAIAEPATH
jgi:hypothetical protein